MSYFTKVEYEIIPKESYKVIRNCPKCGCKTTFLNTNNFRINANGNQVDVWLIYQCDKCKHTYNLSIYERVKPSSIKSDEYKRFLANDVELAWEYGNSKNLFIKNKAEIDYENIYYDISIIKQEIDKTNNSITIKNPYELKVRLDKVLSEILGLTRSQVKRLVKEGNVKHNHVGQTVVINLNNYDNFKN